MLRRGSPNPDLKPTRRLRSLRRRLRKSLSLDRLHWPKCPRAPVPKELAVGKQGIFQPGVLLQGWFVFERSEATTTTFRMRRAEISAKGDIIPERVSYRVMFDVAKVLETQETEIPVPGADPVTVREAPGAISVFQDFFITFQSQFVDVSLGQFKIPVSYEGYNSSSKLILPERALVSREFGDRRDLGLRLEKKFDYFGYSAGLFNGSGLNNLDANNSKDVALRLEAYPLKGLVVGAVGYATLGERDESGAKDRWELDLSYEASGFLLRGEYIRGRNVGSGGTAVEGHGFYGAVGYRIADMLEPVVRVGYLDPDTDRNLGPDGDDDEVWHFDAGINWYLSGHEAKLQLAYGRFEYNDLEPNNQVIAVAQVSY